MDKTMLKFKVEEMKRKTMDKAERAGKAIGRFYIENPMLAVTLTVAGLKATGAAIRYGQSAMIRRHDDKMRALDELKIWDPSAGHRWFLKKPLSNQEWLNIKTIMETTGKSLGDVLMEQGKLR